ncbi:MAG: hypothetical protein WBM84_21995 [Sedimenticolaceae bacterium]
MSRKPGFEIGLLIWVLCLSPLTRADVWHELDAAAGCDRYQPMDAAQLALAERLFSRILQSTEIDDAELADAWSDLGYGLIPVPGAGPGWLGLYDQSAHCRGQGAFLINRRPQGSLVIQAPHAYHDRYSGEIVGRLLMDDVAVLAWNSARRGLRTASDAATADLARRLDSLFAALTRAFATLRPHGRLVQIHGFGNEKRNTQAGATAAAIVSSGSDWSTQSVTVIARCLHSVIDGPVRVYPHDVAELGATKNVQGQILRSHGHDGFVHLELNRPTRERLRSDAAQLTRLADCLGTERDE